MTLLNAFISHTSFLPVSWQNSSPPPLGSPTSTSRRPRNSTMYEISARSLESYREGRRFNNSQHSASAEFSHAFSRSNNDNDDIRNNNKDNNRDNNNDYLMDNNQSGRNIHNDSLTSSFSNNKIKQVRDARIPQQQQQQRKKSSITLLKALLLLNVASAETCSFLIRCSCVQVNGVVVTDEKAVVKRSEDKIFVNDRDFGTVDHGTEYVDQWQQRRPRTHRDRPQSQVDSLTRRFDRRVDDGFYNSRKFNRPRH